MKFLIQLLVITFVIFVSTNCTDEEFAERDYPRLITLQVSDLDETGATFNAEIYDRGNLEILNYGFVWSVISDPRLMDSEKKFHTEEFPSDKYSLRISNALRKNTTYYVRGFVQTSEQTVYAQVTEFRSAGSLAPVIFSFSPQSILYGDTLIIRGENFSSSTSNSVDIGSFRAHLVEATDSLLKVTVPYRPLELESTLTVQVADQVTTSTDKVSLIPLQLTSISPTQAAAGEVLTLHGNFGILPFHTDIIFNGVIAQEVNLSRNSISVKVPSGLVNPVEIVVKIGVQSTQTDAFEILP